ncbi:MAG TPA: xanthine dehydrogenase family protein molybdopterin-binding subunit [Dehalococcoidia bacterium]|nr:xanthine dehydrogenase family protein molybdopterin-binding subunit [Dehalococcoidia bacterium]
MTTVGTRQPRLDGRDKVTGEAVYAADVRLPRMLHARTLRSRYAHARIRRIDVEKARRVPGVRAVVTAADLPAGAARLAPPILVEDRALTEADIVAAVAAEDPETAQRAVDLIEVDYEPLEPQLDWRAAIRPEAPEIAPAVFEYRSAGKAGAPARNVVAHSLIHKGDLEAAWAASDKIVEMTFETQMVQQVPLEPWASTADWDAAAERLTVYATTQAIWSVRAEVARGLGLAPDQVRVICTQVGGGFGAKLHGLPDALAGLLAIKARRPVQLVMSREEEFLSGEPRRPAHIVLRLGARRDGTITGLRADCVFDVGAYSRGGYLCSKATTWLSGIYRWEAVRVESVDVVTNRPLSGAYRGPTGPKCDFALESAMDTLADRLGIDRLEFRLKNVWRPGDTSGTGQVIENGALPELIARVRDQLAGEAKGPDEGIGYALAWWSTAASPSGAFVKVDGDGRVTVIAGSTEQGSASTNPGVLICAAEELGVPAAAIHLVWGDTEVVPIDGGASGSRTTHNMGHAVRNAAIAARDQLLAGAAERFEVDPDQITYQDGLFWVAGDPARTVDLRAIARYLENRGRPVLAAGSHTGRPPRFDPALVEDNQTPVYMDPNFACHGVKVRVDRETGRVEILRYVAAQDVGTAINPLGLEGNIQGGVVQGIGMALTEGYVFAEDGRLLNPNLTTYLLPTPVDTPDIETILVEGYPATGPYGAKGVGELPVIAPPAAIANAIHDAVGARVTELPITMERLRDAIETN